MPTQMIRGSSMEYTDRGAGLPLVLVHGFPLDSRVWEAQANELFHLFRVITVDLPGFGRSSPSLEPFTITSLAEDLHVLLGTIGALPCALAGLSMGGYVSLAFARRYPADLRALVLVDTKAEGDSAEAREGRGKMIDLVRKSGAPGVAEQMMPRMLSEDTASHRPHVTQTLRRIMEACPAATIENALAAMRDRPDQTDNLPSIPVPTLIIVGESDAITPPKIAHAMQRMIPQATCAVITGAGHMSPMEQPTQVTYALRRFLHEHP